MKAHDDLSGFRKVKSPVTANLHTDIKPDNFTIYIINLDRSPDRLEAMAKQLNAHDLDFERVPAVDGSQLDLQSEEIRQLIDFDHWAKYHHRDILPSEIGCYLSHLRALQTFMASDSPYAVILEDDADITPSFPDVLNGLAAHHDKWDLVKLHSSHPGYQRHCEDLSQGNTLTSFVTQTGRATGYVISQDAAEKLYRQLQPARLPFDHIYDRNFEHGLKLRGVMPMPIRTRPVESTIEVHRKKHKTLFPRKWGDPPLHRRWRVPLYRLWTETRRLYYNLVLD